MRKFLCFISTFFTICLTTQVFAIPVAYTGSYDEATGVEAAGDFDNIGGPSDVGDFSLLAGTNTFTGSIFTPGDSSDVFNIVIGTNQTLIGASIVFAENASPFNPYFAFPPPNWGLYESTVTPTIFEIPMGPGNDFTAYGPLNYTAPGFSRGSGIYNMLIGNGTFGMNNGGGVDYTMTFLVDETPTSVPEPSILALMVVGIIGLGFARRRRIVTA